MSRREPHRFISRASPTDLPTSRGELTSPMSSKAVCANRETTCVSPPNWCASTTAITVRSETYDRKLDDMFKIQDEIASAVAAALQITLSRWATYTRAGRYAEPRGLRALPANKTARAQLERALQLDPGFGLAWYWLSQTWVIATDFGDVIPGLSYERASQLSSRAIAVSPGSRGAPWSACVRVSRSRLELAGCYWPNCNVHWHSIRAVKRRRWLPACWRRRWAGVMRPSDCCARRWHAIRCSVSGSSIWAMRSIWPGATPRPRPRCDACWR